MDQTTAPADQAATDHSGTDLPPAPLLTLDTLITRPVIDIDGERYEMLSPDELSVIQYQRFGRWHRQLQALQAEGAARDDEVEALVGTIAREALPGVPEAVIAKLTGTQMIAVTEVFIALLLQSKMRAAGAVMTATGMEGDPWTGASSSPSSPASTAEARASGWRKRLWAWFGLTR